MGKTPKPWVEEHSRSCRSWACSLCWPLGRPLTETPLTVQLGSWLCLGSQHEDCQKLRQVSALRDDAQALGELVDAYPSSLTSRGGGEAATVSFASQSSLGD